MEHFQVQVCKHKSTPTVQTQTHVTYIPPDTFFILCASTFIPHTSSNWNTRVYFYPLALQRRIFFLALNNIRRCPHFVLHLACFCTHIQWVHHLIIAIFFSLKENMGIWVPYIFSQKICSRFHLSRQGERELILFNGTELPCVKTQKKGRTKNVSAFDIFFPLLSSKVI